MGPNMIGAYGPWAASLAGEGPARLSFRRPGVRAGEIDGELVDRDIGTPLEDVHADDVAAHGADA